MIARQNAVSQLIGRIHNTSSNRLGNEAMPQPF